MGSFYSRLSYSFGNEDWRTEQKALNIQPDDSVLCITASGDRPLNLLLVSCKEMVSIDANPIQNHLLHLKTAALKELDYEEYISFLGAKPSTQRGELFRKITGCLPSDSLIFWQSQQRNLANGVLYAGAIEKKMKIVSKMLHLLRGKKIDQLFSFDDLKKQGDFLINFWDTKTWRKIFDITLHPSITKIFIKDPGLYENLEESFHVGKYIYKRMHSSLERFPAKENLILSLCLQGKVYEESYPPYLKENESQLIKDHLNLLSIETTDLITYLESAEENSFDCFSLSDVVSYMSYASFENVLKKILKCAKPNARFCIRQFLTRYPIPKELQKNFQRDFALEEQLEQEDRCFLYRFLVGVVNKEPAKATLVAPTYSDSELAEVVN